MCGRANTWTTITSLSRARAPNLLRVLVLPLVLVPWCTRSGSRARSASGYGSAFGYGSGPGSASGGGGPARTLRRLTRFGPPNESLIVVRMGISVGPRICSKYYQAGQREGCSPPATCGRRAPLGHSGGPPAGQPASCYLGQIRSRDPRRPLFSARPGPPQVAGPDGVIGRPRHLLIRDSPAAASSGALDTSRRRSWPGWSRGSRRPRVAGAPGSWGRAPLRADSPAGALWRAPPPTGARTNNRLHTRSGAPALRPARPSA